VSVIACKAVDVSYTSDGERTRAYKVTYESITNDQADHARVVVLDLIARVPFGTQYSLHNDSDAYCFAKYPKNCKAVGLAKGGRRKWRSDIEFSNHPQEKCSEAEWENPIDEPYKLSGSFVRAMRAATKDRHGEPVDNSVDEPVLPAPEVDDSRDTVIIESNTATIDLALRSAMRDKVNSATIWGLPPRTVKLGQWSWSAEYYGQCHIYIVNRLEFEINKDKWNFVHIDRGFRIVNGEDDDGNIKYTTLMDDRDQPLREPRLLDGAGALLPGGGSPFEIEEELADEADLRLLPVPNPLF